MLDAVDEFGARLVPKVEIPQSLENIIVEQRVGFSRRQAVAEGEQRQGGMIGAERTEHRGALIVARSASIDAVGMERGESYHRNRNRVFQQTPQFNGAAAGNKPRRKFVHQHVIVGRESSGEEF